MPRGSVPDTVATAFGHSAANASPAQAEIKPHQPHPAGSCRRVVSVQVPLGHSGVADLPHSTYQCSSALYHASRRLVERNCAAQSEWLR